MVDVCLFVSAKWVQYFSLDPKSAKLSLAKEIPVEVTTPSEILSGCAGKWSFLVFFSLVFFSIYLSVWCYTGGSRGGGGGGQRGQSQKIAGQNVVGPLP